MTALTQTCQLCGKPSTIDVDEVLYKRWKDGQAAREPVAVSGIQVIFGHLSADEREQIMSGTHPECWASMFGEEE